MSLLCLIKVRRLFAHRAWPGGPVAVDPVYLWAFERLSCLDNLRIRLWILRWVPIKCIRSLVLRIQAGMFSIYTRHGLTLTKCYDVRTYDLLARHSLNCAGAGMDYIIILALGSGVLLCCKTQPVFAFNEERYFG